MIFSIFLMMMMKVTKILMLGCQANCQMWNFSWEYFSPLVNVSIQSMMCWWIPNWTLLYVPFGFAAAYYGDVSRAFWDNHRAAYRGAADFKRWMFIWFDTSITRVSTKRFPAIFEFHIKCTYNLLSNNDNSSKNIFSGISTTVQWNICSLWTSRVRRDNQNNLSGSNSGWSCCGSALWLYYTLRRKKYGGRFKNCKDLIGLFCWKLLRHHPAL